MFGLMRPAKSCGNPKTVQRMHYCGTCKIIGQQYGQKSRLLLNYDAVFLAELLTSLAGENPQVWASPLQAVNQCFKMPKKGEEMPLPLQYAAAANVFLAELKLDDSIRDRAKGKHKFMRWFMTSSFFKAKTQLEKWGLETNFFWQQIETQSNLESAQKADFQTIEECLQHYSQTTAQMTAALFTQAAHVLEMPNLAPILNEIGLAFGEMVYALDAFEDLENDIFTQQFNPLSLFFGEENGSIGEEFLEKSRQLILSKAEEIAFSFAALPIENEAIEQFQARLTSNVALRLYKERTIPQTFSQKIVARWHAAKNAASDLLCAPESKGKKFQYHFFSVIFFVLPTLSVELSQQNRSQMFSSFAIFTAMLAAVGLAQSVVRKKQKRGLWQRLKGIFSFKKRMCDTGYCEDCCDGLLIALGIILGVIFIVVIVVMLVI